jgi:TolB-like protein
MDAGNVFFGPFRLHLDRRQLSREDAPDKLGSRAIEILCALVAARGEVVTKDELLARVWQGVVVEENAIQVHVSALRKALDQADAGSGSWVMTVPGRGYRFSGRIEKAPESPPRENDRAGSFLDKPSIAVMPFSNLSGDADQEYFADGISEDIITALSRSRWFFVIARNSTFAFKGKSADARHVAHELGVQYVLEGSVRKSGQRVRIATQLIDASLARQVWAERFDFELSDVFTVQDEITERVAGAIEPELLKSEGVRALARGAQNLNAWDLVRQGTWQFHHITKSTHMRARELFQSAIGLDPRLPEAHMWLGRVTESIVGYGWSDDAPADLREAVRSSLKGIELDEKDPYGHYALSMSYLFSGALEEAIQASERALELSPTFALAHLGVGMARFYAGDAARAIDPLARGLRLNPFDPQNFHWFRSLALAYCFSGKPADGLPFAMKAAQVRPVWRPALEAVIVCQVESDRLSDAIRSAERWRALDKPERDVLEQLKIRNPQWADRMASALVTAGCVD